MVGTAAHDRTTAYLGMDVYVGSTDEGLEGPDELISLHRAGELSGLSPSTLRRQAYDGKLRARKLNPRMLVTTRRWLHAYLTEASERDKGSRLPLPEGYMPPDHPAHEGGHGQ